MKASEFIKGKTILITGGTGSFGHQIIIRLLDFSPRKIIIFSRDEKKQYDMQNKYKESDLLEFIIGDVRDYNSVYNAMKGVDIVYHAAALKHIPNCEFHPFESVKTNILGAENVRTAAQKNNVDTVVALSTDKAVKPINVMGMTKAIQEKIMLNPNNEKWGTRLLCVRYGNVLGSRGSVIPFFKKRIEEGKFLPVTDYKMTRFLLMMKQAIDLVFKATVEGNSGELFAAKMPACRIIDLAKAMVKEFANSKDYLIKEVGIRPGEKIHEVMVSGEEMRRVVESETHYVICHHGKLKKPLLLHDITEYTSNNTRLLNQDEIASLVRSERWWDKE